MEAPKKPLNLEQAGNYLKEKDKTLKEDMKKDVKKAPISLAPPKDRHNHIMYGISLMVSIPESIKNRWCLLVGKSPTMYSTQEVRNILRKLLVLRLNNCSIKDIAHHMKSTEKIITKVEELAKEAVKLAIERKKNTGIPIIGGKN